MVADRRRFGGIGWHPPDRLPEPVPPSLAAAVVAWGNRLTFSEFPTEDFQVQLDQEVVR